MAEIHHPTRCECCFESCCSGIATEPMCVGFADGIAEERKAVMQYLYDWIREPGMTRDHKNLLSSLRGDLRDGDHIKPKEPK